jgi:hypothetical protein
VNRKGWFGLSPNWLCTSKVSSWMKIDDGGDSRLVEDGKDAGYMLDGPERDVAGRVLHGGREKLFPDEQQHSPQRANAEGRQ